MRMPMAEGLGSSRLAQTAGPLATGPGGPRFAPTAGPVVGFTMRHTMPLIRHPMLRYPIAILGILLIMT